jgi:hypothetical protein
MNNSLYTNCRDFLDDIDLVFNNCILYNGEKSVVGTIALNVRREFNKLYDQFKLHIYI